MMEKLYLQNLNSYRISFVLAFLFTTFFTTVSYGQNVTVNPGAGSYATLKDAFEAINLGTHTGSITVDIVANTTETAPAVLNASGTGSASYSSILLQPSGGAARTVSGAIVAGSPLIDLNGADNVTIDGLNSGGNSLIISNTTVSATANTSTIRFINDATNNSISNTSILGSSTMTVATTGGNIFFSTGVTGNDNNTISNCNIGPAGSNLPSKGIQSIGTATAASNYNNNNTITGNNLFDIFSSTVPSAAVYIAAGNTDWTISNNKIYQSAARTQATATIHAGIQLASANINNCSITGNIIGFADNAGNGTYTITGGATSRFYPIYVSAHGTTTATSIQNNTIKNISISGTAAGTSTSSPFTAILVSSSGLVNIGDVAGNTIGSSNASGSISFSSSSTSSADIYGIYYFPSQPVNIENNIIGGIDAINTSTGAVDIYCIRAWTTSSVTNSFLNNTIGYATSPINNGATSTSSNTYGIYSQSGASLITGNTISNLTMGAGNTGTGTSASMIGIWSDNTLATIGNNISNNTIHSLSNTNASAAVTVLGIQYAGSTTGTHVVANNIVHSLSSGSSSATSNLRGINVTAGTSAYVNNMVRLGIDGAGANITLGLLIYGIYDNNTVATGNGYYYNTVYVGGTGVSGTANSYAFRSDGVTNTRDFRNNSFHNARSNGAGTGKHYAIQIGGTGVNPTGLTSDRNNLRADGASGAILGFYDGADRLNIGAWISATGQDMNSVEVTPDYMNETGNAASVNLKIDPATSTFLESGGVNITGITIDFEGNIRQGNGGYGGTGTAPDIGADEFEGSTPTCSGTPASSNAVVSMTPPLCPGALFTLSLDVVHVAVNYQWQSSPDNSTWTDIPGATFSTQVTSETVSTYYRAVVTCPASGMSTNSASVFVSIYTALSGTYTIDNTLPTSGTNYNNFVDAVTELNCRGISASVIYNVTAGQIFTSSDSLNITATGTAGNTITFQKSGVGANPIIQRLGNSATTNYILRIGGGDYITFNGIDFEQTGSGASDYVEYGIYLQNASITNGAKNNTFKNFSVTMTKSSVNSKGVYVHSVFTPTATSGTNSSNSFLNFTVQNSFEGVRIGGASNTFPDDNNAIDTDMPGLNSINTLGDGGTAGGVYGVVATYQTNFKVKNTDIYSLSPSGISEVYGIYLLTSTANSAEISNNLIHDIAGGGTVNGIIVSSGDTVTIFNNNIYTLSTTGTASALRGIGLGGTGLGANVFANKIYDLSSSGITGTSVGGIDVGTGLVYKIHNNMISDLRAPASTSTAGGTKGIVISSGSTGGIVRIYYNSVVLSDVSSVESYTSAGIYNASVTPTLDIRNNIIVNKSNVTTGTRAVAFWKTSVTDNVDNASNNNLYYAGSPSVKNLIYYDGTTSAQTIPQYNVLPAITPGESSSVTEDVDFDAIASGIIRPNPLTATYVESGGQSISGYTDDFENTARGPYPLGGQVNGGGFAPDMGADEGDFKYLVPPVPNCPTLNAPANGEIDLCPYQVITLTWNPAVTGGLPTLGYDVYFGTNPTPPFVANTSLTSYTPTGMLPNETYYWKIVPKNPSGDAVGCTTYSFTTINIGITSTTPGSRCGIGSVMLGATGNGTLTWYANSTGGTALGMGNSFSTPTINTTTNFYVSALGGTATDDVGAPDAGSSGTYTLEAGLLFDVFVPTLALNGVYIYPIGTGAGVVNIALKNSGGTTLESFSFNCTGTATPGVKTFVPLNWEIPEGTQYFLDMTSRSGNVTSLIRDFSADILGGPIASNPNMTIDNVVTITSGRLGSSGTSTTYYFFYDWEISTSCESGRTSVTATVNPSDPINISPTSVTRCPMDPPTSITASSSYAYTYTWSPTTGLDTPNGPTVMASPSSTTTYTVVGNDGTCANTATVDVIINNPPTSPMAAATPNPVCEGNSVDLSSSATAPAYIVSSITHAALSGTPTSIFITGDDTLSAAITLPFTFNYFGSAKTQMKVSSNGWITFNASETSTTNTIVTIPAAGVPNDAIYVLLDDVIVTGGGSPEVRYFTTGSTPTRTFVVEYSNVKFWNSGSNNGLFNAQLHLKESTGNIEIHILDADDPTPSNKTIGIENSGGTQAVAAPGRNNTTFNITNASPLAWRFVPNTLMYSWSGPNGFNSNLQNPMISAVTAADAGLYTVSITDNTGCSSTASVNLEVTSITVANTDDTGAGSLREIISCAGPGATITFAPALSGQTITLTSGEITINKNLTISGLGAMNLTVSGNNASRIFHVLTGNTVNIEDMSLINGASVTNGGAFWNEGTMNVDGVIISGSTENGNPKGFTGGTGSTTEFLGNSFINN